MSEYRDIQLSHPPRSPNCHWDIWNEFNLWIRHHSNYQLYVNYELGMSKQKFDFVIKDLKSGVLYFFDIMEHHQLHKDGERHLNDNTQIYYRSPEFLTFLGDSIFKDVKTKYDFSKGLTIENVAVTPHLLNLVKKFKNIRQLGKVGYNYIYGVIGTDHIESVSQRIDNLIEHGRCDMVMEKIKDESKIIESIRKILATRNMKIMFDV